MLLKDYAKCQSVNISLNLKNFILGQFWPLLVQKPQQKNFSIKITYRISRRIKQISPPFYYRKAGTADKPPTSPPPPADKTIWP